MNYAFERAHAPHVDPEWTNAFIAEARLANLNGTTIGDACLLYTSPSPRD